MFGNNFGRSRFALSFNRRSLSVNWRQFNFFGSYSRLIHRSIPITPLKVDLMVGCTSPLLDILTPIITNDLPWIVPPFLLFVLLLSNLAVPKNF